MRRRSFLLGAAALLALAGAADARQHHPARGHRIPRLSAPLDAFATPAGAYSFRKLKSTYSGPAVRIRRASDNAELDIGFVGYVPGLGSPIDYVAANSHCAATSCFVKTWYDQSGAARDLVQATAANQVPLLFNCQAGLPCLQAGPNQYLLSAANFTPAGTTATVSRVAGRTAGGGVGDCQLVRNGNSTGARIAYSSAGAAVLVAASGGITVAVTQPATHSLLGRVNGASSTLLVDGASTAGTVTGDTVAGLLMYLGDSGTVCRDVEGVIWDNYLLTAGEAATLQANQKSFWGTP